MAIGAEVVMPKKVETIRGSETRETQPALARAGIQNPRRILAGRLNQKKRGEITQEGREKLRQTALRNQPWQFSTGPRTTEGKAIVARNGKARQKGATSVREKRERRLGRSAI